MTEQTTKVADNKTLLIFVATAVVATVLAAGLLSGRYMEKSRPMTPDAKLQIALQAFRSGYDQTALSILTPLAKEGNAKAQYWLADIYIDDDPNSKPDVAKALVLLENSAAQGFVPAERRLGDQYLRGTKLIQDFGKARDWLYKAAVAGDANAQEEMGHIFALGLATPQDLPQAYAWYEIATLHGDGLARIMRDDLLKRMSPAEVDKGEQTVRQIASTIKPAKK